MDIKKFRPVATLSAIGAVIVLALAGRYAIQMQTQTDGLKHTIAEQTAKIAKDKKDFDALTQAYAELQAIDKANRAKGQGDAQTLEQLRGSIDAFAKQAASCETVRQQLSKSGTQS